MKYMHNQLIALLIVLFCPGIFTTNLLALCKPQQVMDINGNVVVVWEAHLNGYCSIQSASLPSDGRLSAISTLSHGQDCKDPQLAINNHGDIVCIWIGYNASLGVYSLYGSMQLSGDKNWTSSTMISSSDENVNADFQIRISDSSNIVATWSSFDVNGNPQIKISLASKSSNSWSKPEVISKN